jgi:3-methyl-2-oxobutanoate hydroxymethyltransferase
MKKTILDLQKSKIVGDPITWLTCYDYSFAKILGETELDMILVGDSGGMVLLGYEDTVPVTMEQMLFMCSAVRRGATNKFIVGDMPKGSYETSNETAVENAMRFVKESGVDAVKLEGGVKMSERVRAITDAGISVIGHIGLTPQTSNTFGGYRVTGRSKSEQDLIVNDAKSLENSGAFAILVEAMPALAAKKIVENIGIPVLGIGAGPDVDGQLLILHDMLGLYPNFRPKFAKNFIPGVLDDLSLNLKAQDDILNFGRTTRRDGLYELSRLAVNEFILEVKNRTFPDSNFTYSENKNQK